MIFFQENYDLALRTGDPALRDALGSCLRRHERTRFFKDVDRILLGGLIKKTYRRFAKDSPAGRRISMTPPQD